MKTKTINMYSFDELSDEAKKRAVNNLADINVDHEWWVFTYDDAKRIGLKITGFGLDRHRHADGEFIISAIDCSERIIHEHGEQCETYKTAMEFISDTEKLAEKYEDPDSPGNVLDSVEYDDLYDDLEQEFLDSILEDYSIILQQEYEYLTSSDSIIDTIQANEYDFDINGNLI